MLTFDEATRFIRMQEQLRRCTWHEIKKDGHHKSSEGAMSIAFHLPAVVGDASDPHYRVWAYSYLLCPEGRSASWDGRTPAEAISKAEDAIDRWCLSAEMEMFAGQFDCGPDEEDFPFHNDEVEAA